MNKDLYMAYEFALAKTLTLNSGQIGFAKEIEATHRW